ARTGAEELFVTTPMTQAPSPLRFRVDALDRSPFCFGHIYALRASDITTELGFCKAKSSTKAGAERVERSPTVLETGMLPLHHAPVVVWLRSADTIRC